MARIDFKHAYLLFQCIYLSNRVDVVETPIQPSIDEQSPPPIKKTKSGEQSGEGAKANDDTSLEHWTKGDDTKHFMTIHSCKAFASQCVAQSVQNNTPHEQWTAKDVEKYFEKIPGCETFASQCVDQSICGSLLSALTISTLKTDFGLNVGQSVSTHLAIQALLQKDEDNFEDEVNDIHSMVMETKEVTRSTLTSCLTKQKLPYLGGSQMGNSHILSDEDGYFNFIGRSKMSKLFQEIENMRVSRNPPPGAGERAAVQRDYENALWKKLLLTGTPGFGKSYMLAALAYQLKREYYDRCFMHRVVYIPDCTNFVNDHFRKMKLALLIAFSSPDEIGSRLEVYSLKTEEDIESNAVQKFLRCLDVWTRENGKPAYNTMNIYFPFNKMLQYKKMNIS
ncbi:hypothetical protein EMCRGX_G008575 [Ephydatia muelleri]